MFSAPVDQEASFDPSDLQIHQVILSEEYVNIKFRLKWQCKNGHTWESAPTNILRNHWCPECGGENSRL